MALTKQHIVQLQSRDRPFIIIANEQADRFPAAVAIAGVNPSGSGHQFVQITAILGHFQPRRDEQGQKLHMPAMFGMKFQHLFKGLKTAHDILARLDAIDPHDQRLIGGEALQLHAIIGHG